jgi:hypothetical protein
MNVVVVIAGKPALPVRALPFCIDWERVREIPGRRETWDAILGSLDTYRAGPKLNRYTAYPRRQWLADWRSFCAAERIDKAALERLPAGVFVWKYDLDQATGHPAPALP